jgi:hypothetical protein
VLAVDWETFIEKCARAAASIFVLMVVCLLKLFIRVSSGALKGGPGDAKTTYVMSKNFAGSIKIRRNGQIQGRMVQVVGEEGGFRTSNIDVEEIEEAASSSLMTSNFFALFDEHDAVEVAGGGGVAADGLVA